MALLAIHPVLLLSICVGLLAELVLLVDAFCAAADPTSAVRASTSIETNPTSFDFMAVLLCVSVNGVPLEHRLLQNERLPAFGY